MAVQISANNYKMASNSTVLQKKFNIYHHCKKHSNFTFTCQFISITLLICTQLLNFNGA